MRKFLALAALVLGLASCQNEPEGFEVVTGGEVETLVTVNIPETETRATAGSNSAVSAFSDLIDLDAYTARFIFEIYYENTMVERQVKYVEGESTSFRVRLIPNRDYQFVVWADIVTAAGVQDGVVSNDLHYVIGNTLQDIQLNNTWVAMDESRDAFTVSHPVVKFNSSQSINIELKRPFAKLRVVTTDYADITKLNNTRPTYGKVVYRTPHYNAFDAFNGTPSGAVNDIEHNYDIAEYSTENDASRTIFSDYFFAKNDDIVNFVLTVYDQRGAEEDYEIKSTAFMTPISVKPNFLTTLTGNILTDGNDINVVVNPGFGGDVNVNDDDVNFNDYTVITSGAELLRYANDPQFDQKYILGCDITVNPGAEIDENTANGAIARAATRSTAGVTTTINLNGYTIKVKNTSGNAAITVADGNTLVIEGEGTITLDEECTAPFIANENTTGGVIIEAATVNSNNHNTKVVEGNAVVNSGADVDENAISGETTSQLNYVLENGGEVTLLQDATFSEVVLVNAVKPVVINGNGKTLNTSANRAIRITQSNADVTINDLNIVSSAAMIYPSDVRGISVDAQLENVKLTLNNCNIGFAHETAVDWTYGVNVSGNGTGHQVTVNGGSYEGANVINVHGAQNTIVVKNAILTSEYPYSTKYYGACIWVKQEMGSSVYAEGNTFNGNNAIAFNLGTGTTLEEKNNINNTMFLDDDGKWYVSSAEKLQLALNNGYTDIVLYGNIVGNVTVTQKPDVLVTIDGKGHNYAGYILVDGKSATYTTAGLTIEKVNFVAENITADACINLGKSNDNNTRYTCNVTVKKCTFDVPGAVGIKSYTGGDKNLVVENCTATAKAHSLVQAKGIDSINVENCTINSKNGLNFNNSTNVTVENCNADVRGYAVRFGEGTTANDLLETYTINNSTLKSACKETGDAVIVLRGSADKSTLTIENTTLEGSTEILNTAVGAKVIIDGKFIANSTEQVNAAIADGITDINLAAGNYELSALSFPSNLKLVGVDKEKTIVNLAKSIYLQDKVVNLENLTFNLDAGKVYDEFKFGFVHHAKEFNLKNCNVNRIRLNALSSKIEECTFSLNTSNGFDGYCIYYYGGNGSVSKCTFDTAGKAIIMYNETAKTFNVEVSDCVFTSSNPETDKAAIQMHTECGINGNLNINRSTATGFADINNGLWNEVNNTTKEVTSNFAIRVDTAQVH